jgi:F-box domain
MTTNSPASTFPACFIESLPNEILERIISFVALDDPVQYRSANGDTRYLSQVIALMHTSRAFRSVTMECKFWIDYDFDFADLVPDIGEHPLRPETRLNGLCYLLFSIPELARNLQRKTDWLINTAPEILFGAMASFPIVETARNVCLFNVWAPSLLLNRLSYCKRLISLEIRGDNGDLELGALEFFDSLKRLTLDLPRTFRGQCARIEGLEHFAVCPSGFDRQWLEFSNELNILPSGSKTSLVSLDITGYCCERFTLDEFDHLENLGYKLNPLPDEEFTFFNPLSENSSRISSLETEFITLGPAGAPESELAIPRQTALFLCPCFAALKQISLKILFLGEMNDPNSYIEQCMVIVGIIAKHLVTLEVVTLHAGLDISWTVILAKLTRLRSLTWNFPQGGLRGLKSSGEDATETVRKVFKDFVEPPNVCVQLVRWNVQDAAVMPSPGFVEFPE